ncbi:MFS transporter [Chroococcidiopsis thermalis]|uniref:Major facilitator superfamily MFS_1 n=1 Tax=Chroococcidiopsis thermalis (strain PCC 7203) TaxID=251229 RepID=K9U722_CHRTP|nr:MFS transporter [Chroococcidiopsis thermalis]AFY90912.1 major facilitator superfamily MFS_1 [Chroococcidiopsis thermalis PCC 7203]
MQPTNSLPVKITLLVVSTLTVMAGATIAPSLPAMKQHFSTIPNADYWVRLILTAPALFIALAAPFIGATIDRLGRKPVLIVALLVYGLAGSSGLWLNAIGFILFGRALLGLSVAGVMVTATALIADYYTGKERGQFLGIQAAFMALGGVIFLTLGGFLADINWRMPFFIYLIALVLVPCVVLLLPEPNRTAKGAGANVADEPTSLATGLVVLTYAIALISQIVFYLIPVQLPFYLQQLLQASSSQSGLAIALATGCSAVSSLLYQRVKARLSFISIYGIAFLNMALGYESISFGAGYAVILLGLAIAGLGLGLLMPNMNFCLTSIAPGVARGRVLGGLTTSFFLGQFLSPLVSQPLTNFVGIAVTYRTAGIVMGIMAIAALVFLMRAKTAGNAS